MQRKWAVVVGSTVAAVGAIVGGILGTVFLADASEGIPIGAAIGGAIGAALIEVLTNPEERRGDTGTSIAAAIGVLLAVVLVAYLALGPGVVSASIWLVVGAAIIGGVIGGGLDWVLRRRRVDAR
jgi:Na+/phosphate symporter